MKPWRDPKKHPNKGRYPNVSKEVIIAIADPFTSAKIRMGFGYYDFTQKEWMERNLRVKQEWVLGWKYKPKYDRHCILKSQSIAAHNK